MVHFIITYALSNKMKHIENNSAVAIAGEWFTARGKGINLGYFGKKENHMIAEKLKDVFAEWIDNGWALKPYKKKQSRKIVILLHKFIGSASGSVMTVICKFITSIKVSCLHFGQ